MIVRLTGTLIYKNPPFLFIEVQGVAYEVLAPMSTIYQCGAINESISLFIHHLVREDCQQLYGFSDLKDRELFQNLIKVNGIGAKLALTILSATDSEGFHRTIFSGDTSVLTKIPGIGKKTAERLMMEMRDRLDKNAALMPMPSASITNPETDSSQSIQNDAIFALESLGYSMAQAQKAILAIDCSQLDSPSSETLIKKALAELTMA